MIVPGKIQSDLSKTYTEDFFKGHAQNINSYIKLAGYLKNKVTSITDYGCGHGLLVECLIKEGVDAFGLEGSESAQVMWNKDNFNKYKIIDFTKDDNESIIPNTEYVITTEVAEHIANDKAENFVKYLLVNQPKGVYFGAATYFQDFNRNPSHVNEQPIIYWVNIFNKFGYDIDIKESYDLKLFFNNNMEEFIRSWWYIKNMLVFKKKSEINIDDFINIDNVNFTPKLVTTSPIFNMMYDRDSLEYSNLILSKYLEYTQNKKLHYK